MQAAARSILILIALFFVALPKGCRASSVIGHPVGIHGGVVALLVLNAVEVVQAAASSMRLSSQRVNRKYATSAQRTRTGQSFFSHSLTIRTREMFCRFCVHFPFLCTPIITLSPGKSTLFAGTPSKIKPDPILQKRQNRLFQSGQSARFCIYASCFMQEFRKFPCIFTTFFSNLFI